MVRVEAWKLGCERQVRRLWPDSSQYIWVKRRTWEREAEAEGGREVKKVSKAFSPVRWGGPRSRRGGVSWLCIDEYLWVEWSCVYEGDGERSKGLVVPPQPHPSHPLVKHICRKIAKK